MPRDEFNLVRHELIGLKVKIIDSKNKKLKGISGAVVYETYNTIIIENLKKKRKTIPKKGTIFVFELENGKKVKILGNILVGRPEDRIKKKFPKWKLSEINS